MFTHGHKTRTQHIHISTQHTQVCMHVTHTHARNIHARTQHTLTLNTYAHNTLATHTKHSTHARDTNPRSIHTRTQHSLIFSMGSKVYRTASYSCIGHTSQGNIRTSVVRGD